MGGKNEKKKKKNFEILKIFLSPKNFNLEWLGDLPISHSANFSKSLKVFDFTPKWLGDLPISHCVNFSKSLKIFKLTPKWLGDLPIGCPSVKSSKSLNFSKFFFNFAHFSKLLPECLGAPDR